jgi:hypothetical protein
MDYKSFQMMIISMFYSICVVSMGFTRIKALESKIEGSLELW